jgi:hypothetical protein
MRVTAFVMTLLGTLACAGIGGLGLLAVTTVELVARAKFANTLGVTASQVDLREFLSPAEQQDLQAKMRTLRSSAWSMISSSVLGLVACVLAMKRRGLWAALLLLVAGVGPLVFVLGNGTYSGLFVVGGIFAFFIPPSEAPEPD